MSHWSGRINRLALIVAAMALLAGTPAILAAAKISSPLALAGATAAAAIVVGIGAVWQQRYQAAVQRWDEAEFSIRDGCLVLADGRLPTVRDISDPVMLGVHRAAFAGLQRPLRARDLCVALDLPILPENTESIRSKLKRLAGRGILSETEPGLFAQPRPKPGLRASDQGT